MSYDDSALDSGAPRTLSANSYGSMPQNSTVVISIPIGRQFSDTFRESLGTLWPALNHTKTVVLRGSPTITLEAYQRRMEIIFGMLSQLPTLEVLCIAGHHTGQHTIAKGFKIFDSLNGASNPAAPIFPKLRSIRLQGLIFNQASHNANGFGPFGYGVQHSPQLMIKEITCDDFISSIQWIKGVRASALQYISFKNCSHVGDEITESLEELGIFVERDRHSMSKKILKSNEPTLKYYSSLYI
ncbi:hypothetical protein DL96DRAFT_1708870 [Flagelloscypha sp. PMI_526]|nr:hypothetical protein DL96DRAFT_1708870 [Flagelloscypha sp. PMI_526]